MWLTSSKATHMRNVIKDLNNSVCRKSVNSEEATLEAIPDGFRDAKKFFVVLMTAAAWAGMDDYSYG